MVTLCTGSVEVSWVQLAANLPGHSAKQIREWWTNQLDPNVNRSIWTPAEDALFVYVQVQFGSTWMQIAQLLPGRINNNIKNHWHALGALWRESLLKVQLAPNVSVSVSVRVRVCTNC